MPHVIAVSSPSFAKSAILMEELAALGPPLVAHPQGLEFNESELSHFFVDAAATIAVVGREVLSPGVLDHAKKLKFVAKYGVGLDNLDPLQLAARGISLGWTGGVNRRAVAELVLAFAIGHLRNVFLAVNRSRHGLWIKDGGRDLSAQTVGIIGYGCVGSEVAKILKVFGCQVFYTDIVDRTAEARVSGARPLPLDDLLRAADVVTLHVPWTPATQNLMDERAMRLLKPGALLINTSRGAVVDFEKACTAVQEGRLGGFAADVFPQEPMDLAPWAHPHLYFTPHIGGNSREAVLAMGRSAIQHVRDFLASCGP